MTDEHIDDEFGGWMILELMGHRRMAGLVTDVEVAGSRFLRIDVYGEDTTTTEPLITQYYSPSAIYCITPTREQLARSLSERYRPAPVARFELPHSYDDEEEDRF